MNEPFIIDHDNPKKIIVSDYNDFASCYEHYPLYFKGNRIYVLGVESERTYLKNRVNLRMEVYEYSFWKPIPEPKFRPMTWEEALPILCSAWIESDNFNYKSKVKIIYTPDGWDKILIGRDFDSIGDDETGNQFKTSVEKELKGLIGEDIKCSKYEEAWRDG
jgi:hypothetical protein